MLFCLFMNEVNLRNGLIHREKLDSPGSVPWTSLREFSSCVSCDRYGFLIYFSIRRTSRKKHACNSWATVLGKVVCRCQMIFLKNRFIVFQNNYKPFSTHLRLFMLITFKSLKQNKHKSNLSKMLFYTGINSVPVYIARTYQPYYFIRNPELTANNVP